MPVDGPPGAGHGSSWEALAGRQADGAPGEEVQVDFGYLGMISDGDRRRKLHALVFTAVVSRYCFVFLTFSQTTEAVIAGCEAAWGFFGGMFKVVVPDNLSPVVSRADRLEPGWNREWLEYMQARGLACDPAQVARVQRDFHVRAGSAFYSVPCALIGQQVSVRADGTLVKACHRGQVVRAHPQQRRLRPPGRGQAGEDGRRQSRRRLNAVLIRGHLPVS